MSQTPFPEQEMPSNKQGIDEYQASFPEQQIVRRGQLDIGPGGIIVADSPDNRELLEHIEQTRALAPIELYMLALSYQQSVSNSGLGNRLGFIGLSTIFQTIQQPVLELFPQSSNPHGQANYSNTGGQPYYSTEFLKWKPSCVNPCCGLSPWLRNNLPWCPDCPCPEASRIFVKSVPYNGLELLIEVAQIDESRTYTILGVSPNDLDPR